MSLKNTKRKSQCQHKRSCGHLRNQELYKVKQMLLKDSLKTYKINMINYKDSMIS